MANPKIEFFRFKLKHKTDDFKTFRDFMVENGKCKNRDTEATIFGKLFAYFLNDLKVDFAKSESIKKVMTLISNKGRRIINKHWDERPKPDLAKNTRTSILPLDELHPNFLHLETKIDDEVLHIIGLRVQISFIDNKLPFH